jgi:hypothetical protein
MRKLKKGANRVTEVKRSGLIAESLAVKRPPNENPIAYFLT